MFFLLTAISLIRKLHMYVNFINISIDFTVENKYGLNLFDNLLESPRISYFDTIYRDRDGIVW